MALLINENKSFMKHITLLISFLVPALLFAQNVENGEQKADIYKYKIKSIAVYQQAYADGKEVGKPFEAANRMYDTTGNITDRVIAFFGSQNISWEQYAYDTLGRKIKQSTLDGAAKLKKKIEYKYDASGKVKEETAYDKEGKVTVSTIYTYDAKGNLLSAVMSGTAKSKMEYTYNKKGKKTTEKMYDDKGKVKTHTTFAYDKKGVLLETSTLDSVGTITQKNIYTYDKEGRKTQYQTMQGEKETYKSTYTYNEGGLVTEYSEYTNGLLSNRCVFSYDKNNMIASIENYNDKKVITGKFSYTYKYY